jgi:hypothetical protein
VFFLPRFESHIHIFWDNKIFRMPHCSIEVCGPNYCSTSLDVQSPNHRFSPRHRNKNSHEPPLRVTSDCA